MSRQLSPRRATGGFGPGPAVVTTPYGARGRPRSANPATAPPLNFEDPPCGRAGEAFMRRHGEAVHTAKDRRTAAPSPLTSNHSSFPAPAPGGRRRAPSRPTSPRIPARGAAHAHHRRPPGRERPDCRTTDRRALGCAGCCPTLPPVTARLPTRSTAERRALSCDGTFTKPRGTWQEF